MEYKAASPLEKIIIGEYPDQFHGGGFWLGINIGKGWAPIVLDACRQVQETLSAEETRIFHWTQVKQKLGGLRMYWRPRGESAIKLADSVAESDDSALHEISSVLAANTLSAASQSRIRSIVDQAEEKTSSTCEMCGASGRLTLHGPIKVLCDSCAVNQLTSGDWK